MYGIWNVHFDLLSNSKWLTITAFSCLCSSPGKLLDVDDQYYQGLPTSKSTGAIAGDRRTSLTRRASLERRQSIEQRRSIERRQSSARRQSSDRRQSTAADRSPQTRRQTPDRRQSRERAVSEPADKRCVIHSLQTNAYTHISIVNTPGNTCEYTDTRHWYIVYVHSMNVYDDAERLQRENKQILNIPPWVLIFSHLLPSIIPSLSLCSSLTVLHLFPSFTIWSSVHFLPGPVSLYLLCCCVDRHSVPRLPSAEGQDDNPYDYRKLLRKTSQRRRLIKQYRDWAVLFSTAYSI